MCLLLKWTQCIKRALRFQKHFSTDATVGRSVHLLSGGNEISSSQTLRARLWNELEKFTGGAMPNLGEIGLKGKEVWVLNSYGPLSQNDVSQTKAKQELTEAGGSPKPFDEPVLPRALPKLVQEECEVCKPSLHKQSIQTVSHQSWLTVITTQELLIYTEYCARFGPARVLDEESERSIRIRQFDGVEELVNLAVGRI